MIVLIDNYDSFSYNVYQLIGSVEPDIKVVRNDEYTVEQIEAMKPEALILSPGPGKPIWKKSCRTGVKLQVTTSLLPSFAVRRNANAELSASTSFSHVKPDQLRSISYSAGVMVYS